MPKVSLEISKLSAWILENVGLKIQNVGLNIQKVGPKIPKRRPENSKTSARCFPSCMPTFWNFRADVLDSSCRRFGFYGPTFWNFRADVLEYYFHADIYNSFAKFLNFYIAFKISWVSYPDVEFSKSSFDNFFL